MIDEINPQEITIADEESLNIIVNKINEIVEYINSKSDQLI